MPCDSSSEALTRQFYEWETRGRGWLVFDYPVALEPPFRRFLGHFVLGTYTTIDDGRRQTGLSSFFDRLKPRDPPPLPIQEDREPEAIYVTDRTPVVEVQVVLPPDTKITKDAASQFLMSLGHL